MKQWLEDVQEQLKRMPKEAREIRELATNDLYTFAKLVNPGYMYGDVHKEFFKWIQEYSLYGKGDPVNANKLVMLPRAHLKSHMVATACAWFIVRHPEITVFYVSATSALAEEQLGAIKGILTSDKFTRYWPEYVHPQEGKRARWNNSAIAIDHPIRKKEGIRDATVVTAGLTTNTTGWHADLIIADDLVVPDNAYTEKGREDVAKAASQFTSIRNVGGFTLACGTRYHPNDIYYTWKGLTFEEFDEETGEVIDVHNVWNIKEYAVEVDGRFTWPRAIREDGKAFGFNRSTLARVKAEYIDKTQFYAQYYNNPNDAGSARITEDRFQYYDQRHLKQEGGYWYMHGRRLNVYAGIDFAFSMGQRSDYTAIVVIGIDCDGNIYILDIDRFKTDKIAEYYKHIKQLHSKWEFSKLRAEVTVAQKIIVNDIKDYIKNDGMRIAIDEFRPNRTNGSKEERIAAALEPRYEEMKMYHFKGGHIPALEEELMQARPQHDDLKDCLASVIEIAVKPSQRRSSGLLMKPKGLATHSRFGGVAAR